MRILVVSDQGLIIKGNEVLGTENFTNTLKRLKPFGELYACVLDASQRTNHLVYNDNVTQYISKDNIVFIKKSFIWPSHKTISLIENQVKNIDLVVGYLPALNAEVALNIAHRLHKKYLAFLVACPWDCLWNQDLKRKIGAPYRFLLVKKTMKNADYAMYVTGNFFQNRYPTMAKLNIGLSDVVLSPINDTILQKRLLKINNKNDDEPIKIATVATLNENIKGQHYVIKAIRKLKEMGHTNYKYYLIGGGSEATLRKLSQELDVSENIIFVGKVSHENVFQLLDDMDIYIQPSLAEGLPRSVIEAMSRALPCIGSSAGAIPELIDQQYITQKKSVEDIVKAILSLSSKQEMISQSERNFSMVHQFECGLLDNQRNDFYKKVMTDVEKTATNKISSH
ncbi:MAG: glycosyltransferase [Bacteroides sp.]|nr:glycosyltransferase [Bacteroides sp.]